MCQCWNYLGNGLHRHHVNILNIIAVIKLKVKHDYANNAIWKIYGALKKIRKVGHNLADISSVICMVNQFKNKF